VVSGSVLGVLLVVALTAPSAAQTTASDPSADPGVAQPQPTALPSDSFALNGLRTDYVWSKENLDAEIVTQRQAYRDQLEMYRRQEKNFLIAQDQYKRLGTLDSIEQAVKATRQFLLSRDQVLHTYLTLLELRLMAAGGVELSLKTDALNKLELVRTQLQAHHDAASGQLDRAAGNKLADDFKPMGEQIKLLSSQVSGLLAVGQLQVVHDKALALRPDIAAEVTATGSGQTVSPETTRSLRETSGSLDKEAAALTTLWGKVAQRINSDSPIQGQSDFAIDLNASYANLSKTLAFYLELLKLFHTVGAAAAS
jgi:hypothetical protein